MRIHIGNYGAETVRHFWRVVARFVGLRTEMQNKGGVVVAMALFNKIGRNRYGTPSGRTLNTSQVANAYRGGAGFPGGAGMADQLGPSLIRSPTAPGSARNPRLTPSGKTNAATSPTPTSILNGGKQTFGPLAYGKRETQSQEYVPDQRTLFHRTRSQPVPKKRR